VARAESGARCLAEADRLTIESVELTPPELPTDSQLGYARDLEIDVPAAVSKDDLSELISIRTNRDKPPRRELKEFAEQYGVFYPDMTGKKSLFNRIFWVLKNPGREADLCAWFAYRVYRTLVAGSPLAAVKSPFEPDIQSVAAQLAASQNIVDSIRNYGNGEDFIWFGTWTDPDGVVHAGGSKRTFAYEEAAKLLAPVVAAENAVDAERIRRADERRAAAFKPTAAVGNARANEGRPKKFWRVLLIVVVIALALAWHYH
jgi:hypothetical protein